MPTPAKTFRRQRPSDSHRWTEITEPAAGNELIETTDGIMKYEDWCARVAEEAGGEVVELTPETGLRENSATRMVRHYHGQDARFFVVMGWAKRT